jgi:hypothetical protein
MIADAPQVSIPLSALPRLITFARLVAQFSFE